MWPQDMHPVVRNIHPSPPTSCDMLSKLPLWRFLLFVSGMLTSMTIMFYRGVLFNALMCKIGLLYLRTLFPGKTVSQLLDYNDRQKLKIASFAISTRGWNARFDYPTLSKSFFFVLQE